MSNDEIYVDADEVRSFANRFGQLINTSYRPQLDKISDEIEDTESSDDPESSAVDEAGVEAYPAELLGWQATNADAHAEWLNECLDKFEILVEKAAKASKDYGDIDEANYGDVGREQPDDPA